MGIHNKELHNRFSELKTLCEHLPKSVIKEYFPDGDFEEALNQFFDRHVNEREEFHLLNYPFRGEVFLNENKFSELVATLPEFVVSIIKAGMPNINSLNASQISVHTQPILLSLDNLNESSMILYSSWNLLAGLGNHKTDHAAQDVEHLRKKLAQVNIAEAQYDIIGIFQLIYNSMVLMVSGGEILNLGLSNIFYHSDPKRRALLISLTGNEHRILRLLDSISGSESVNDLMSHVRLDLIKHGYPQLNQIEQDVHGQIVDEVNDEGNTDFRFHLQGEYWDIRFDGKNSHLNNSVGLKLIHTLLKNPSQSIRAERLTALSNAKGGSHHSDITENGSFHSSTTFDRAPNKTYSEMTNKIKELEHLLPELVPGSDEYHLAEEHLKKKRKERSKCFNRNGQERPNDPGEKARQSVSAAITAAKKKINPDIPDLVIHLTKYLNTGYECIYDPPPGELKSWLF